MTRGFQMMLATGLMLAGMAMSMTVWGADAPATTTKPASALPACCGDACKKMSHVCCTVDDKGKATCAMGGSCCVKTDTKPADTKPAGGGMGGMPGMGH